MLFREALASALVLVLLTARSAVAAQTGQALAPSPSEEATRQAADGSFTLGPVANATLLNSTFLRMEGVPATVSWLQFSPTHTAGTLATANFTNGERGSGIEWLGRHQASLFGTVSGNQSVMALSLSSPAYTPSLGRLDMVYEVLESEPDALPLAGGSLNGLMTIYKMGAAAPADPALLVSPDAGTMFSKATLVIDTLNTSELATGPKVGTRSEVIYVIPVGRR